MSEPELKAKDNSIGSQAAESAAMEGLKPSIALVIALLVFLADQASKRWIVNTMTLGDTRPLFGQAFRLTLTHNTGGAWGLLPQGNTIFALFAAVAIVALLIAYHRVGRLEYPVGGAFALALGGAVGNLLDRVRLGYVVDFFDARIIHWPVFNIADSAITMSILLLVVHFLHSPSAPKSEYVTSATSDSAAIQPDSQAQG